MIQQILPLPLQKVRDLEPLMIFFHLNNKYIFIWWSRYPWRPIWRRGRFPEHTPSHITNHLDIYSTDSQNSFIILNLFIIFSISSGATFTSNSQEIQGRLSADTGIISELTYNLILHISDNHPSACQPCIIWIIWQPNTTIPASSSRPSVPAGSNFDEIHLKQVSIFSFGRFYHTLYLRRPL